MYIKNYTLLEYWISRSGTAQHVFELLGGGGANEERVEFFFWGGHAWEYLFDFSEVTENAI